MPPNWQTGRAQRWRWTVRVVEVRDLDGPNWFRLEPVIKLALALDSYDNANALFESIAARIVTAHELVGEPVPRITRHPIDPPDQFVVAFDWQWRSFALGVARFAVDLSLTARDQEVQEGLLRRLGTNRAENDCPVWVRDSERTVRSVGVTGTNGKTTTTRLLAHVAQQAGTRVGWSSSTGVFINGEAVLEGDYSGPSGARRVLLDPDVELSILETARGGLLLRGLAYESNDVGVFLNISADHLSLQGVDTVKSLADVKSVVIRVTRPDGLVVLNADDPLILDFASNAPAPVALTSQQPDADPVRRHIGASHLAVVREQGDIVVYRDRNRDVIAELANVPMTYGGAAPFMVDNALAATAAAIGLGFEPAKIAAGLSTFRNDSLSNKGRLNIFEVEDRTVIIDYAHNDTGLAGLAGFARNIAPTRSRLHVVVGTAGDRRDEDFLALGRTACEQADVVYLKDTPGYRRGRKPGEMTALMRQGFSGVSGRAALAGEFDDEIAGFLAALESSEAGDLIAVMCQVDQDRILDEIERRGGRERDGSG